MKINKNAWHFKFLMGLDNRTAERLDYGGKVSFCDYMRALVWNMLWVSLVSIALLVLVFYAVIVPLFYTLFGVGESLISEGVFATYFIILMVLGISGLFLTTKWISYELNRVEDYEIGVDEFNDSFVPKYLQKYISFKWLYNWKVKQMNKPIKQTVYKQKEPSVFYEWYKSFKNKVCPIVELDEGEK
jgi:hypothetical protein